MEKLGDYLPLHRHGMLGRIYLAKQLEEATQQLVMGELTVVIRGNSVVLNCVEAAYAKRLSLERRKLEGLLAKLAGSNHKLTLKIRAGG